MSFTFTFTEAQTNIILGALSDQPFKDVVSLITLIHQQANAPAEAVDGEIVEDNDE